jgi:hypothetical protein
MGGSPLYSKIEFIPYSSLRMEHLPAEFQDASRDDQTQIATLGIQCWTILKKEVVKIKELDYTTLTEQLKDEARKEGRREAEREAARQLKEKEYIADDLQAQVIALEHKLQRFNADKQKDVDRLVQEARTEGEREAARQRKEKEYAFDDLQAQVVSLEKKLHRLTTDKQKEMDELETRTRKEAAREAVLTERSVFLQQAKDYEVQIAQLLAAQDWKTAYLENQKIIARLEEQLEGYKKIKSSYEIGQEGEEETESMLRKIPEWDYERVSKEKDRADFRMISKDKKAFILDSKKYVNSVPKKERDKLMSNVDDDATVSGGILVSLDSKITTKENCEIETTPGKKVVCYLNLAGLTTEARIAYIGATLKFLYQYVASHDEREKNELMERLVEGSTRINELKKETENMRNKAKELYESLKVNVTKIQAIMDYICNKPVENVSEGGATATATVTEVKASKKKIKDSMTKPSPKHLP